jgi:hypothetical protein
MAPEAANNAAGTGSILPMLVLGIPGSPTAAIMMAGIFMWGFIPGPRLFVEQPEFVWSFIASLYLANVAAVVICLTATPILAMMLRTPYAIITPIIVVLCFVGAYAIQNSLLDVWLVLIFGIIGFILRRLEYPLAPLVVALVLGAPTETALRQSLIMSDGSMMIFLTRPVSGPIAVSPSSCSCCRCSRWRCAAIAAAARKQSRASARSTATRIAALSSTASSAKLRAPSNMAGKASGRLTASSTARAARVTSTAIKSVMAMISIILSSEPAL